MNTNQDISQYTNKHILISDPDHFVYKSSSIELEIKVVRDYSDEMIEFVNVPIDRTKYKICTYNKNTGLYTDTSKTSEILCKPRQNSEQTSQPKPIKLDMLDYTYVLYQKGNTKR